MPGPTQMYDVIVIGGGLSGLVNAILLSRAHLKVALFEKKTYPFHRVCGEYLSNEAAPFLLRNELYPEHLSPAKIDTLCLSSTSGKSFTLPLKMGAFGVSRFAYDQWLADKAKEAGCSLFEGVVLEDVSFDSDSFSVSTSTGQSFQARYVIGAHGKRSKIDQTINRPFLAKKSPYVGVKYHAKTNLADHIIYMHNFEGGYCGITKIEAGMFNICYLIHRDVVRTHGSIAATEKAVLRKNPHLRAVFEESEFLLERPEVINEISFEPKEPVFDHILMAGDAAGTITPLSGNGMANAIRSASILADLILTHRRNRATLESEYSRIWRKTFSSRLFAGRQIQRLFGSGGASSHAVFIGNNLKTVADYLISKTHGAPF